MSEQLYLVYNLSDIHDGWMDHCMVWWRPKQSGYTSDWEAEKRLIQQGKL